MFKWNELALAFGFFNNSIQLDPMLFQLLMEDRRRERAALAMANADQNSSQAASSHAASIQAASNDSDVLNETSFDKKAA